LLNVPLIGVALVELALFTSGMCSSDSQKACRFGDSRSSNQFAFVSCVQFTGSFPHVLAIF
jgi:hypothetical protein